MIKKIIKINRNDYNNVYILGDAHLDHDRPWIVDVRGFKNIFDHNKWILEQLYALGPRDLLINLGDFMLSSSVEKCKSILSTIRAKHYYAANGNHESFVSKIYQESVKRQFGIKETDPLNFEVYPFSCRTMGDFWTGDIGDEKDANIVFLGESSTFQIGNMFLYCRHMAPLIWDKMKYENQVSLVAHSHGNLKTATVHYPEPKQLDIGVDNAKKYNGTCFFKFEDICDIMKHKKVKTFDHHGNSNV